MSNKHTTTDAEFEAARKVVIQKLHAVGVKAMQDARENPDELTRKFGTTQSLDAFQKLVGDDTDPVALLHRMAALPIDELVLINYHFSVLATRIGQLSRGLFILAIMREAGEEYDVEAEVAEYKDSKGRTPTYKMTPPPDAPEVHVHFVTPEQLMELLGEAPQRPVNAGFASTKKPPVS